jgi:hypothetical protein
MRKAGDILSDIFSERFDPEFAGRVKSVSDLFSSWEEVAAEADIAAAAAHSRVADNDRGTVLIEADHPGWVQLLQTRQARLLEILQNRHGKELEIRDISFRLSRRPAAPRAPAEELAAVSEAGIREPPDSAANTGDSFDKVKKRLEVSIKNRNQIKTNKEKRI